MPFPPLGLKSSEPDFAIAFDALFGGFLFELVVGGPGSLIFVADFGGGGTVNDTAYEMSGSLADIGLAAGDTFSFVGTYITKPRRMIARPAA